VDAAEDARLYRETPWVDEEELAEKEKEEKRIEKLNDEAAAAALAAGKEVLCTTVTLRH
jgi:hypothetical protein